MAIENNIDTSHAGSTKKPKTTSQVNAQVNAATPQTASTPSTPSTSNATPSTTKPAQTSSTAKPAQTPSGVNGQVNTGIAQNPTPTPSQTGTSNSKVGQGLTQDEYWLMMLEEAYAAQQAAAQQAAAQQAAYAAAEQSPAVVPAQPTAREQAAAKADRIIQQGYADNNQMTPDVYAAAEQSPAVVPQAPAMGTGSILPAQNTAAYAAAEQSPAVVPQAPAMGTGNINQPYGTADYGATPLSVPKVPTTDTAQPTSTTQPSGTADYGATPLSVPKVPTTSTPSTTKAPAAGTVPSTTSRGVDTAPSTNTGTTPATASDDSAWDFGPNGNPGDEARRYAALYAPNDYARWLVQRGEAADMAQAMQIVRGYFSPSVGQSTPPSAVTGTPANAYTPATGGRVDPLRAQAPDLQSLLDQWAAVTRQQSQNQIDYATQQGITELQRAQEDAQPQFQTQRDQVAAAEAKALDNQALYAERRGDRGGIGAAQYAEIQNNAAQNQLAINQAQTKLSTDTARQIADLRAQGEYQKADQLLQIAQQYLSQLITLQQWNAEFGLNVATFNKELEKWNLEFEADVASLTGMYQGQPTLNALGMMAEAGLAAAQSGIMPSESQLQALERLYGYDRSAILGMLQTATLGAGGGYYGGGGGSSTGSRSIYGNGTLTSDEVAQLQRVLGVTVDGQWGPESAAAAAQRWGASSAMTATDAWNAFAGQANSYQAMLAGLTGGQQTGAGLTAGGTPNAGASSSPVDMADTTGRMLFDSNGRLAVSESQLSTHARNALVAARNAMQSDPQHGREVASNLLETRARSGYLNNAEYAAVLTLLGLIS